VGERVAVAKVVAVAVVVSVCCQEFSSSKDIKVTAPFDLFRGLLCNFEATRKPNHLKS
jgi:hypothetical protein